MENFELIENYLTNKLSDADRAAFENLIATDPTLKADVEIQGQILDGIKKARMLELKSMLNNVPVGGISAGFTAGKIATAFIGAVVVGTSLYLFIKPSAEKQNPAKAPDSLGVTEQREAKVDKTSPVDQPVASGNTAVPEPTAKKPVAVKKKESAIRATQKPKIDILDPSDELVDNASSTVPSGENQKSNITISRIAVESNATDKNYHFHYQFNQAKLILYGAFDKSLYEILEIHGDNPTVFLYYKDNYYLLNEKDTKVTPLEPIRDPMLIKKLKEYKGQ
jgi:hypothetical protein